MFTFKPESAGSAKIQEQILEKLPEIIDNKGTIFAYGYLLERENLKRLFEESRPGKEGNIYEAGSIEEAQQLVEKNPEDVVILRNVKMEGVRAQIITSDQFVDAYKKKFGKNFPESDSNGEAQEYLYVRQAEDDKMPRYINGGLVIGLNNADLRVFDIDEGIIPEDKDGVYWRKKVPELKIENRQYQIKNITFYSGNAEGDIHKYLDPENKGVISSRIARSAILEKKKGREISDSAKWPHSEEHRVREKWEGKTYNEEMAEKALKKKGEENE